MHGHVLEMGLTTRYAHAHLRFLITLQLSALKDIILTLRVYRKKIYKFNDTWQILAQNSMFNSNIVCSFFACVSSFVPSFILSNVFFWLWSIGCCRLFTVCVCE